MSALPDLRAACAQLQGVAQRVIVTSGFSLMFSCRAAAAKLFLLAVVLAGVTVMVPSTLAR